MDGPKTKAELIDQVEHAHARMEVLLSPIPDSLVLLPCGPDEWSVKDLLVHITYWQDSLAAQLHAVLHDLPVSQSFVTSEDDTDCINYEVIANNRQRQWDEVLSRYRQSYQHILQLVACLAEEELFYSECFRIVDTEPLWRTIASETYEHHLEHMEQIEQWWNAQRIGAVPY